MAKQLVGAEFLCRIGDTWRWRGLCKVPRPLTDDDLEVTMHYAYPATMEQDGAGYMLRFDSLPGVIWDSTPAEALDHGHDLLTTALEMLLEDGDEPPAPLPSDGRPIIEAEV